MNIQKYIFLVLLTGGIFVSADASLQFPALFRDIEIYGKKLDTEKPKTVAYLYANNAADEVLMSHAARLLRAYNSHKPGTFVDPYHSNIQVKVHNAEGAEIHITTGKGRYSCTILEYLSDKSKPWLVEDYITKEPAHKTSHHTTRDETGIIHIFKLQLPIRWSAKIKRFVPLTVAEQQEKAEHKDSHEDELYE